MNRLGDGLSDFFRSIPPPQPAVAVAPKRCDEAAVLEQRRRHLLDRHIRPTDVERLLQPERLEHGLWVDCPRENLRRPGAIEERLRTTLAGSAALVTMPGNREARCT